MKQYAFDIFIQRDGSEEHVRTYIFNLRVDAKSLPEAYAKVFKHHAFDNDSLRDSLWIKIELKT